MEWRGRRRRMMVRGGRMCRTLQRERGGRKEGDGERGKKIKRIRQRHMESRSE